MSLADLIVLGGSAAIEKAAADAGVKVNVAFHPGRMDATQAQTDVNSFAVLEPKADGFRNYFSEQSPASPAEALIEKANFLNLTVPEMTVLVGGLRVLNANSGGSKHGVFTQSPGKLSNDFFVNLLDMSTRWEKGKEPGLYQALTVIPANSNGRLRRSTWCLVPIQNSEPSLKCMLQTMARPASLRTLPKPGPR